MMNRGDRRYQNSPLGWARCEKCAKGFHLKLVVAARDYNWKKKFGYWPHQRCAICLYKELWKSNGS